MIAEWRINAYLLVESDDPVAQLKEVVACYGMPGEDRLFGRCLVCDMPLEPRDHREIQDAVPEYIARIHRVYFLRVLPAGGFTGGRVITRR